MDENGKLVSDVKFLLAKIETSTVRWAGFVGYGYAVHGDHKPHAGLHHGYGRIR